MYINEVVVGALKRLLLNPPIDIALAVEYGVDTLVTVIVFMIILKRRKLKGKSAKFTHKHTGSFTHKQKRPIECVEVLETKNKRQRNQKLRMTNFAPLFVNYV